MRSLHLLILLAAGGLLLAACDAAPGPADPGGRPPVLSEFSFSPEAVLYDTLPPGQLQGDRALVTLKLRVRAADPDDAVREVRFVVQAPGNGAAPFATGELVPQSGDVYAGQSILQIPRGDIGLYTVIVYATDEQSRLSNQVRGILNFTASGSPPVLEAVEAPATVQLPKSGEPPRPVRVVAVVSDPDGPNNLQRVVLRTGSGAELEMRDDGGGESGDLTAGDGRFTITLQVEAPPRNKPGPNTFTFQAFDRLGLFSNIISKTITLVE